MVSKLRVRNVVIGTDKGGQTSSTAWALVLRLLLA